MLKEWQFNVLFFVGVGGAVLLLLGPSFGFEISKNPTTLTGVGSILAYVLTQKKALTRRPGGRRRNTEPPDDEEGGDGDG